MMTNTVQEIKTDKLVAPWIMLRPVRQDTVEWLELVDSVRDNGILNSILVRPHPTRDGFFEVIDGMWRVSACKSLDIPEIPAILKVGVTDAEVLELQIQANAVSYETRPVEFAEQMQRMISIREEAGLRTTMAELGQLVGKSASWVSSRLQLLKLYPHARYLIREGKLCLGKAVALARIKSQQYQEEFLKKSTKMKVREFELAVGRFIADIRQRKMGERRDIRDEITLKPRLQSMDMLLIELDRMENVSQLITQENAQTPLHGAKCMLEWVLNLHGAGRDQQVREARKLLSHDERRNVIGRQRYEELKELRRLREERNAK